MNEFNAVSTDELTKVEGGSLLEFVAGAVAALAAPVTVPLAVGAVIGYTVASAAMK